MRNCEYCGTPLDPGSQSCPGCGAPNPTYDPNAASAPVSRGKPATIAELQAFCRSRNMPLEKMRFFIGVDEPSPRAFGIYRDGRDFVVYKNKADGSRAIRYRGPDEAFAVNELYQKLRQEVQQRKGSSPSRSGSGSYRSAPASRKQGFLKYLPIVLILLGYLLFSALPNYLGHRQDGYYRVGDDLFYRYGTAWFMDAAGSTWTEVDGFPYDDYSEYYEGSNYDDAWGSSDFTDTQYWDDLHSSDDDSDDSDWDYDYDDWDTGDTDWDSDW